MKYYLIVGEASGDLHASRLMRSLKNVDEFAEFRFFGGDLMAADGYGIGAQIAERPADERPDFVVGLTDVLASGVISALVDKGISVPEQVRVAGCDGNPLAWSGSVPLTTVAPPGYEIGRKGVQLLMEQIENKPAAKTKRVRIGSAARTVTAVTAIEDINRQELVRPFLLERASTQASSQPEATAINLGGSL